MKENVSQRQDALIIDDNDHSENRASDFHSLFRWSSRWGRWSDKTTQQKDRNHSLVDHSCVTSVSALCVSNRGCRLRNCNDDEMHRSYSIERWLQNPPDPTCHYDQLASKGEDYSSLLSTPDNRWDSQWEKLNFLYSLASCDLTFDSLNFQRTTPLLYASETNDQSSFLFESPCLAGEAWDLKARLQEAIGNSMAE